MRALTLRRILTANGACMGVLSGLPYTVYTLEEAPRGNKTGISCIPAGTYACTPHGWELNSPVKKKQVWELKDVPDRTGILIHIGNTTKDTEGCILVGMAMTVTQVLSAVADSTIAINHMRKEIGAKAFTITIVDEPKAA
jgi:hypothetical protein